MEKQVAKRITWVIDNFSSLQSDIIYSDEFVAGGCKWLLLVFPKGYEADNFLSLFLRVVDSESLPCGWRRCAKFSLTVVNQNSEKNSELRVLKQWFDVNSPCLGKQSMVSLKELHARDGGFLVNRELKIVVEIEVLEVIGTLDISEETSTLTESMDVNGFQLLPSQVKSARRIFERHPEIASDFCPKKPNLRTAYMSMLLSLVETMCMLPQEVSKDDLSDAYVALGSMSDSGFKLDWLEKKLDEMSDKKEKEEVSETRMQDMEKELNYLKLKCSDLEAQLEKEKEEVLAAKAPFSFDDVV